MGTGLNSFFLFESVNIAQDAATVEISKRLNFRIRQIEAKAWSNSMLARLAKLNARSRQQCYYVCGIRRTSLRFNFPQKSDSMPRWVMWRSCRDEAL